jgi:hypothetical protein
VIRRRSQVATDDRPFSLCSLLFHLLLESTFGASRFAAFVSKYSRGLAPMILAVMTMGNRRMYVLCLWTASL